MSSGSRSYDHFVHLNAVTPGEYKLEGVGLTIEHAVHDTPFGKAFMVITHRGVYHFSFLESAEADGHRTGLHKK